MEKVSSDRCCVIKDMGFVAANSLLQSRHNSSEARERARKSWSTTRAVYRHRGAGYDKKDSVLLAWLQPDIACDSVPGRMATGLPCAGLMTSGGGPSGEGGQAATRDPSPLSVAGVCG